MTNTVLVCLYFHDSSIFLELIGRVEGLGRYPFLGVDVLTIQLQGVGFWVISTLGIGIINNVRWFVSILLSYALTIH